MAGFERFQPWFLNLTLANIQTTAMGYLPNFGVENYFVEQKPAEMDILELETLQEQLAVLQSFNNESFLLYILMDFECGKEQLEALISAWQCGD